MARPAHLRVRRVLIVLALTGAIPFVAGCPQKATPVVDAGPPPPPPVETVTNLVPMEEDAGQPDADAEAGPIHRGPAVNVNVARMQACCNALAAQGKQNANSPEGQMILSAAAQCNVAAKNVGPSGTAPEFAMVRQMLAGKTLPAACAGL
ncbi:MAG: hypothetical protein U0270_24790 [Labilithrix sp.]